VETFPFVYKKKFVNCFSKKKTKTEW